jgi:hypothetical protein
LKSDCAEKRAPRIGSWQLPNRKKILNVSEHRSKNKLSLSVQALAGTCNLPNKSLTEASIFFSRQIGTKSPQARS